MASASEIVRTYFEALSAHDLDGAAALWQPGGIERVGGEELRAPDALRGYFEELFAAFPDFRFTVLDTTTYRNRCAVRWRGTGTFAGPGCFQGFAPNGARGARAPERLASIANVRTRVRQALHGGEPEVIAPGVWVLRGGRAGGRLMNVYLLEEEGGGVSLFDAGIAAMAPAIRAAAARFGGIRRVVLGHADCDHRGAAATLGAPVLCHPGDRDAARAHAPTRTYWNLGLLKKPAQLAYPRLFRSWDGGGLDVAGTVEEGEQIAGFRAVHLPGHAPGLIALHRDSDRLALISDCLYTVDVETGRRRQARVPHPAFSQDTEQARDSIRKLAALEPAVVWAGHGDPVSGEDVAGQLERAAAGR